MLVEKGRNVSVGSKPRKRGVAAYAGLASLFLLSVCGEDLWAAPPETAAGQIIESARKDLRANRAEKAFDALTAWLAKNPTDQHSIEAQVLLGTCALRLKRDDLALRILERVIVRANGDSAQAEALEGSVLI